MEFNLELGKTYELKRKVSKKDTAKSICSGCLEVLGSPVMFGFMEIAAFMCVDDQLGDYTTVGIKLSSSHLAPTPVGMEVTIKATLTEVCGRKLIFDIIAEDEKEVIGKCTHERFIIDPDKFMKKVNEKAGV